MGYRPKIICKHDSIELGKFYGYVKLDGLKSIEWLKNNMPSLDINEFTYNYNGPILVFTADEFREFMDIYEKDINDYDYEDGYISYTKPYKIADHYKEYESIYSNDLDKIIEWS